MAHNVGHFPCWKCDKHDSGRASKENLVGNDEQEEEEIERNGLVEPEGGHIIVNIIPPDYQEVSTPPPSACSNDQQQHYYININNNQDNHDFNNSLHQENLQNDDFENVQITIGQSKNEENILYKDKSTISQPLNDKSLSWKNDFSYCQDSQSSEGKSHDDRSWSTVSEEGIKKNKKKSRVKLTKRELAQFAKIKVVYCFKLK